MAASRTDIPYIRREIPDPPPTPNRGERRERLAPATLDLAERARLAVNAMVEPTDPDCDYRTYWKVSFRFNPPVMYHDLADMGIVGEMMSALPRMRLMSGSDQGTHVEQRWKEMILHMVAPDGLLATPMKGRPFFRPTPDKLLHSGFTGRIDGDHLIEMDFNGQVVGAAATFVEQGAREFWEPIGRGIVDGLSTLAVHEGDQTYHPMCLYRPGERATGAMGKPKGVLATYGMWGAHRMVQFFNATGYQPALDLAGKLCRYIPESSGYFGPQCEFHRDNDDPASPRHHIIHFHAHTLTILACLEYALAAKDQRMMEWAVRGFERAKTHGECLTGFFPENINPVVPQSCEICEVADMVRLAVRLAAAGLGDAYWDDADRWVRNQLAEGQLLRCDWIYRLHMGDPPSQLGPEMTADRVGERNLGGFGGWQAPNDWIRILRRGGTLHSDARGYVQGIMHCCTANGGRALYDVWRNVVHDRGDNVRVNLLLNHSSAALDIDSHLPYTGQVDFPAKRACKLAARLPAWVDLSKVECAVGGQRRAITFDGRYAQLGEITAGQSATLRFPLAETTDRVTMGNQWYFLVRRGHDVVFIDPPGQYCPLYQRDHYRGGQTLWRQASHFLPERVVNG